MFSKKLEDLIKASLQDGLLTDQERLAILKRAEQEGEDPDEVAIYIQSLMQKSQQEHKKEEDQKDELLAIKKKEALGRVCPKCGKPVPPLTLKCECGYEFQTDGKGKQQKSAVQELMEKIESISKWKERSTESHFDYLKRQRQAKHDAISLFPVPNTKEDIIDFLSLSAPKSVKKGGLWGSKGGRFAVVIGAIVAIASVVTLVGLIISDSEDVAMVGLIILGMGAMSLMPMGMSWSSNPDATLLWNEEADAWRSKFDQVLMKGRSLRGDPEFQQQLDYYERIVNSK